MSQNDLVLSHGGAVGGWAPWNPSKGEEEEEEEEAGKT